MLAKPTDLDRFSEAQRDLLMLVLGDIGSQETHYHSSYIVCRVVEVVVKAGIGWTNHAKNNHQQKAWDRLAMIELIDMTTKD